MRLCIRLRFQLQCRARIMGCDCCRNWWRQSIMAATSTMSWNTRQSLISFKERWRIPSLLLLWSISTSSRIGITPACCSSLISNLSKQTSFHRFTKKMLKVRASQESRRNLQTGRIASQTVTSCRHLNSQTSQQRCRSTPSSSFKARLGTRLVLWKWLIPVSPISASSSESSNSTSRRRFVKHLTCGAISSIRVSRLPNWATNSFQRNCRCTPPISESPSIINQTQTMCL